MPLPILLLRKKNCLWFHNSFVDEFVDLVDRTLVLPFSLGESFEYLVAC